MDSHRVDAILRYALAVASESDEPWDRELGPIHLLKYVYLADLVHAERYGGATFTGAAWRFYHYGPWDAAVYDRVQSLDAAPDVVAKRLASQYEQDFMRYSLPYGEAERVLRTLDRELPTALTSRLRGFVREFGKDTPTLLDYVYRTRPMLRAAPNETLDLASVVAEGPPRRVPEQVESAEPATLTVRAQKKRRAALDEMRGQLRRRLDKKRAERSRVMPTPAPRYDSVFAEGQQMLDRLAGEPLDAEALEARFSSEIWHSRGRAETEFS
jgi:hypothetical protein